MTTRLRQRWLLAVLVAGQFMANVDIAIVNVATPSIHRDLHASGGALEFIVSGYVLAFAMLIITGARLGRILGYRRMYLAGLAADLSGLVNTSAQVAAVAGVAAFGTVYFALAARPGDAFGVVTAALAASGLAAVACSFLSARRGAPGPAAVRGEERVPARLGG